MEKLLHEDIEKLKKAGKIAAEALEYAKTIVKPGISLLEAAEKIENKIISLGGRPAFPAQLSINDIAAHFCPEEDDRTILNDQIVSIDVGVHVDGFIGDSAITIDLSRKQEKLIKASKEALEDAIKIIKPGIAISEIGKAIHDAITKYGFAPIRNLSGHGLDKFNVHSSPTIPNYDNGDKNVLEEGMLIAIEPFASAGAGIVYESSNASVFQLIGKKPVRNIITRNILSEIEKYEELPFCRRWLVKKFGAAKVNFAFRELTNLGILKEYPPLIDKNHGLVSQAEHTVMVTKEGCIVLTKID